MANKNPVTSFAKDKELASRAGKASKKPSKGLVELRKVKATEFEEIIYKYQDLSLKVLKVLTSDESLPGKDHLVLACMIKAIETGDHSRMDFMLNRTIGKVKDKLEVSSGMTHRTLIEQLEDDD